MSMVRKNNCGKKKCPILDKVTMDWEYGNGKGVELYFQNGVYYVKYYSLGKHSETPFHDRSIAWSRFLDVKYDLFPEIKT